MQRPIVFMLIMVACVVVYVMWLPKFAPFAPLDPHSAVKLSAAATPALSPAHQTRPAPTLAASSDVIPADDQDVIRRCLEKTPKLPTVHYSDKMKLQDLAQDLADGSNATPENLVVNVHVKKTDGSTVRLHIQPQDFEAKASKSHWITGHSDIRVFDVDNEGLPVDVPYPAALKLESMRSIIDSFSSEGAVTFSERRFHSTFNDNVSVDVVENGNHVTELQVFFKGNSLGCAWSAEKTLSCKCL